MRKAFANAVLKNFNNDNCIFLTGDLGFMALEEVRDQMGNRFINAGVAEQNMVGVAAGLAKESFKTIVYSIAPFCYARPFEQIRNDICIGNLPVCLVGNGGGYAYGYMGPTHHALEDCAAMQALGVDVIVPAFDEDLDFIVGNFDRPTYLRLGYDVKPQGSIAPKYKAWRLILDGKKGVMVTLGPLSGLAWNALLDLPFSERPALWAASELNQEKIPEHFWLQVQGCPLFVLEEHKQQGGLGMNIALEILKKGVSVSSFNHRYALGYPTGHFGSQDFHREQCGLDLDSIKKMVRQYT